jgi:hypothetical protein
VIEGEFQGAEAIGSSHGDFGLVIQALDDTTENLLPGLQIVQQQFAVSTQGASDSSWARCGYAWFESTRNPGTGRLNAASYRSRAAGSPP